MLALDVCNNAETLKRLKELRLQLNNSEDITRLLPLSKTGWKKLRDSGITTSISLKPK